MNVHYELITDVEHCREVAALLLGLREVAVDVEGLELCRLGKGCLIQVATPRSVKIFDITVMGPEAFAHGRLKELLEGPVSKILCDGRADADALRKGYGVMLGNCYDLQILHALKFSKESDRFVKGLQQILEKAAVIPRHQQAEFKALKDLGRGLFSQEAPGDSIWEERPLRKELLQYAAADVAFLLPVKQKWSSRSLDALVVDRTQQRLDNVFQVGWTQGRDNALRDFSVEGGEATRTGVFQKSRGRSSMDDRDTDDSEAFDFIDEYDELYMEYGEAVSHVASASGLEGKALRDYAEWLSNKDW